MAFKEVEVNYSKCWFSAHSEDEGNKIFDATTDAGAGGFGQLLQLLPSGSEK